MLAATLVDLGAAGAHGPLHDPGDDLDDLLHETDVVEDGEEGADEDDGGQHGEGEDGEADCWGRRGSRRRGEEPSAEWPSRPVMTPETVARMVWP